MSSEQGPIFLNTRGRFHCEIAKAGTEYVAESSSINKSLFFLGKASCRGHFFLPAFDCFMVGVVCVEVIEKLAARDKEEGEHIPFRDSKLRPQLSHELCELYFVTISDPGPG